LASALFNDYSLKKDLNWWVGRFNGNAASVRVRDPAFSARADHGSEWNGIDNGANGSVGARVQLEARVPALVVQAGPARGTFGVDLALLFGFDWQWRSLW